MTRVIEEIISAIRSSAVFNHIEFGMWAGCGLVDLAAIRRFAIRP